MMENEERKGPDIRVDYAILTDESEMPYGAHKGKKMAEVPATYLLWLSDNDKCSKSVRAYVTDNWEVICKKGFRDPKSGGRRGAGSGERRAGGAIDPYIRKGREKPRP